MKRYLFLTAIILFSQTEVFGQIPDLRRFSFKERQLLEMACSYAEMLGPSTYANCLNKKISEYEITNGEKIPDLRRFKYKERQLLESACSYAEMLGPSTYANCMNRKISEYENSYTKASGDGSSSTNLVDSKRKNNNKIDLKVLHTQPDQDGEFQIDVSTGVDTASFKIDSEEQGGRSDGKYSVKKIARAGGETHFKIVATDINGNTETKTITVSRPLAESKPLVASLNPATVKRQPERDAVAIIIGIADYKNLPRADYANDDARVFYDYAIRALGIKPENIKLLVDADADDIGIYQAFKTWLPSRVRANTDVYVYYSGHGLPTADGQGIYLLPQRAHRDFIDKTAITQAEINAAIQAAKPKSVTIFLDACYSGQARTGETLLASARPVALKAERQFFPDSFTVISASKADQISSSSPDLKHGIFSYYLMRGMEGDADANRDGRITAGEMHNYLTDQVTRQAAMINRQQVPQLTGDANRVLVGR